MLPVLLFHAGANFVPGGFVGVDIFFVISGFLITGILNREIAAQRFSIWTFYERRIRRIMPNLLVTLLVTSIACTIILIPSDLRFYAQSLVATLTFMANIFFWLKINYFNPNAEQFPLLHMWSLGVEEQYYLLFPLLMLIFVGRRTMKPVFWTIFLLSFTFSIHQVATVPNAAFYLPFSRLWELMAGSLLAVGAVPRIGSRRACDALGWMGLAAIIYAVIFYSSETAFPGLAALLPCFGAAAIIHATGNGRSQVGRLLALRPMVFVGAISYSLYIWHWPIIVLTKYVLQRPLQASDVILLLVAVLAVAIAAWKWIEEPFRARTVPMSRLLVSTGSISALLLAVAALLIWGKGWPGRYPQVVRSIAMASLDTNPARSACDAPSIERLRAGDVCTIGEAGQQPTFALIGDSFADALAPGVDAAARQMKIAGLSLSRSGCAPLIGVDEPGGNCQRQIAEIYALVRRTPTIRTVLLVGRWSAMVEGHRVGLLDLKHIRLIDAEDRTGAAPDNAAVMARGFRRSIRAVAPANVVILTGVPEQEVNVPQAATIRTLMGMHLGGVGRGVYDRRQARTNALLSEVVAGTSARLLDAGRFMCDMQECPVIDGGSSLYVDDNHPSRTSALARRDMFVSALSSHRSDDPE